MPFRRAWLLFVAGALIAGACGTDDGSESSLTTTTTGTLNPTTTTSTPVATSALTPTTTTSTTTPAVDSAPAWSQVPYDDTVFGGRGILQMADVTTGGPGLVAVGLHDLGDQFDAAVWTSTDGVVWSRVPTDEVLGGPGTQEMSSVTVGGPGLVAVGFENPSDEFGFGSDLNAAVWTSRDGVTWSRVAHDEEVFGGANFQEMSSVTVGGPGLVAVGRDSSGDNFIDAAVWTSPDGVAWSRIAHDEEVFGGEGDQQMISVTVGGPGLVAVGRGGSGDEDDAAVWTSPDGIAWTQVPHDEEVFGGEGDQSMWNVIAGGPGLVAVGRDVLGEFEFHAVVWTSPDGVTWSRVFHSAGLDLMEGVTVGGPGLVAVGLDWPGDREIHAAVWVAGTED